MTPLLGFGLLAALIFLNPFVGLCLTMASVPLVEALPATLPYASSVTALLGGLTLISCLLEIVVRGRALSVRSNRAYGWMIAFGVASLLSLTFSQQGFNFQGAFTYAQVVVLALLTGQLVNTWRRVEALMIVWVLTLVVAQLVGLSGFDFSVLGRANRLVSFSENPNYLAFYSVAAVCFALYFLLNVRGWLRRALLVAALALGIVSIFMTASRGGLVVLVAVVLYAVLSLRLKLVRGLRFGGVVLMAAAAYMLASWVNLSHYVPGLVRTTSLTVTQVVQGSSAEDRLYILRMGLRTWSEHPLFGVGLGLGYDAGAYGGPHSHSTYLTAVVETGIVGLVVICGLFLATWLNLSRRPLEERKLGPAVATLSWAWRAAFVTILLMSLTGDLLLNKILWITIGMGIVLSEHRDALENPGAVRELAGASVRR